LLCVACHHVTKYGVNISLRGYSRLHYEMADFDGRGLPCKAMLAPFRWMFQLRSSLRSHVIIVAREYRTIDISRFCQCNNVLGIIRCSVSVVRDRCVGCILCRACKQRQATASTANLSSALAVLATVRVFCSGYYRVLFRLRRWAVGADDQCFSTAVYLRKSFGLEVASRCHGLCQVRCCLATSTLHHKCVCACFCK
jgi:hypothetical protein